jgi:hypothetical protein
MNQAAAKQTRNTRPQTSTNAPAGPASKKPIESTVSSGVMTLGGRTYVRALENKSRMS